MQRRGFLGALAAFVMLPLRKSQTLTEAEVVSQQLSVVSSRNMRIPLEMRPSGKFGYFNPEGGELGRGLGRVYTRVETLFERDDVFFSRIK